MKKILLLVPPSDRLVLRGNYCSNESKANYYVPPIDLILLSGILSNDYQVEYMDCIAQELNEEKSIKSIVGIMPDIVIFVTGAISEHDDVIYLNNIKKHLKEIILIGTGDILTFNGKEYLKNNLFVDAVLLDYTSLEILDYLKNDYSRIENIIYRNSDSTIAEPMKNLTKVKVYGDDKNKENMKIGIPDHKLYVNLNYRIPHGIYKKFVITSLSFGCPYICSFCPQEKIKYKYRDMDEVILEMHSIHKLGIKEVYFYDQTFAFDRKYTIEFCSRLISENINIKWICLSRVDVMDDELLEIMAKAGCHTIQFGVESVDENILKDSKKSISNSKYFSVFSKCKKLGIRTLGHFIIGLPGETSETAKMTAEYAIKLDCDYAAFNIAEAPLGTTLRDQLIKEGNLSDTKEVDFIAYQAYIPEGVEFKDVLSWRDNAIKSFYLRPTYIFKKLFLFRSLHELTNNMQDGVSLLKTVFGNLSYKNRRNRGSKK